MSQKLSRDFKGACLHGKSLFQDDSHSIADNMQKNRFFYAVCQCSRRCTEARAKELSWNALSAMKSAFGSAVKMK